MDPIERIREQLAVYLADPDPAEAYEYIARIDDILRSKPVPAATLPPAIERKVLDHGYVRLRAVFGDEAFIAESARQSTSGQSKGPELDGRLIRRLWRDGHTSPFEMASCTWDLKAPLFVVQQILRHRTGKFNQFSFRYSDGLKEGRQVDAESPGIEWHISDDVSPVAQGVMDEAARNSVEAYRNLLDLGCKSEDARAVLPVNVYTRLRVQFDVNNAMKFFRLRCADDVQAETRAYADAMRELMYPYFPNVFDEEARRS